MDDQNAKTRGKESPRATGGGSGSKSQSDIQAGDQRSPSDELAKLKGDYADLLKDHAWLATLVERLAADKSLDAKAEARLAKIRHRLVEVQERVSAEAEAGRNELDRLVTRIARNPLASMIAAFGIGYVISRLLGSGRRQ